MNILGIALLVLGGFSFLSCAYLALKRDVVRDMSSYTKEDIEKIMAYKKRRRDKDIYEKQVRKRKESLMGRQGTPSIFDSEDFSSEQDEAPVSEDLEDTGPASEEEDTWYAKDEATGVLGGSQSENTEVIPEQSKEPVEDSWEVPDEGSPSRDASEETEIMETGDEETGVLSAEGTTEVLTGQKQTDDEGTDVLVPSQNETTDVLGNYIKEETEVLSTGEETGVLKEKGEEV